MPDRFDSLWRAALGGIPDWLLVDDETMTACIEWLNTRTWTDSLAYLVANSDLILSDIGTTALAEIALRYPHDPQIAHHQTLLEACRRDGVDPAYAPLLISETVQTWRSIDDLDESKRHLLDHRDAILDDDAPAAIPDDDLIGHALIELTRADDIDRGYELLTNPDATRAAALTHARQHADTGKLRAVAILCYATATDDAQRAQALAHVALSVVLAGKVDDATEIVREIREGADIAALISDFTDAIAHRPDHAASIATLIRALTESTSSSQT
jgi:hypothetical protein